jgi:heterodisulfide reductase subunit A
MLLKVRTMNKSVLVIGGGIAGIQASIDLANMGFQVYLVEKSPSIGGRMAQLDKTFPTNDCAMCILAPKMIEASRHPNIRLLTYSEVEGVAGEAGKFRAKIRKKARFVDEDKCTGCGDCWNNCPVRYRAYIPEKNGE